MVALGLVSTDLLRHELGTEMVTIIEDEYAKGTPLLRVGSTEDVEGIAAYLASDCSSYHSGLKENTQGLSVSTITLTAFNSGAP